MFFVRNLLSFTVRNDPWRFSVKCSQVKSSGLRAWRVPLTLTLNFTPAYQPSAGRSPAEHAVLSLVTSASQSRRTRSREGRLLETVQHEASLKTNNVPGLLGILGHESKDDMNQNAGRLTQSLCLALGVFKQLFLTNLSCYKKNKQAGNKA